MYRALDLIDRELPDESIYGWQKVTHYPKISLVGLVLPHGAQKLRGAARTREALKLVRESGRVGRFLQKQLAHMCGISKVAIAHQFKSNSGLRAEFLNLQRLLLANFRSRSSGEWTQTTPEQFTATVSRIYAADPSHKVTFEELAHELSGHEKNTPLCDLKYAELSKLYNGLKSSKSDLLNAIAEKLSNT
ncbi:hypothetical protein HY968_00300 [Candidatus Kaiserbacteria bacterium]|nr:hypothetical protein [Candidatus Kaiserbacteria bacterium]